MPTTSPRKSPRSFPSLLPAVLVWPVLACHGQDAPAPPPPKPVWDRSLPPTDGLGVAQQQRGLRVARGIIHLHSVYSHDACDYDPQPGGKANMPCDQHLRQGLCQTRQDFAMLTDHASLMATTVWEQLFVPKAGDEPIMDSGELVGERLNCDQQSGMAGHSVVLTVGGENDLMPVGLRHPVGSTDAERMANMSDGSPQAVPRFMDAGGLVLVPHGESRSIDLLRMLAGSGLTGMEVYNLHANIDPNIRSQYLGLVGLGAVAGLGPWLQDQAPADGGPEPDLALLGFLEENQNQIGKYDTLLSEGHQLTAVIGSDIHENTFKQGLADMERGDSYRRLMRWFSNHLLLPLHAPITPATLHDALAAGRNYGVFEIFGTEQDFDFHAQSAAGIAELGATVPAGATLHLQAPRFPLQGPDEDLPVLRVRLLRIAPGSGTSAEAAGHVLSPAEVRNGFELHLAAPGPGAYRAEVRIVPRHLLPLLGSDTSRYAHEYPYIYTSPIYVAAAP